MTHVKEFGQQKWRISIDSGQQSIKYMTCMFIKSLAAHKQMDGCNMRMTTLPQF
jgi:hypothetical protein